MSNRLYGVKLSGKNGHNVIFFKNLRERMGFLDLLNTAKFKGSFTLLETEEREEMING